MDKDPRSTINDEEWRNLQHRADKANPDMWKLTDEKGAQHRKQANDNFKNRDNN